MNSFKGILSFIISLFLLIGLFSLGTVLIPGLLGENTSHRQAVNEPMGIAQMNNYPPPDQGTPTAPPTQTTEPPYPAPVAAIEVMGVESSPSFPPEYFITPTTPPLGEDGWYIYTDPDLGYSFHYPTDSYMRAGKGPRYAYNVISLDINVPNETVYHGMLLFVEDNPEGLSVDEFAVKFYKENFQKETVPLELLAKAESATFSDISGLRVDLPSSHDYWTLLIPYEDKILIVSAGGNPFGGEDPVKNEFLSIAERILETIEFKK